MDESMKRFMRLVSDTRPRGIAVAAGLLLAASVLASGWAAALPLPATLLASTFVFLAVERDVSCRSIPDWLTFGGLAAAALHGAWTSGASGALDAFGAASLVFALLALPFALGALGAGDVKATMALGALVGANAAVELVLLAIGLGAALALLRLSVAGGLDALLRRWANSAYVSLATRQLIWFPPAPSAPSARGIPFAVAVALAVGVLLAGNLASLR
jgi:prepilin peptidase CpaA